MPQEIKHTPYILHEGEDYIAIYDNDNNCICLQQNPASDDYQNFKNIIQALNNHEKLLGILKDIISNCAIKSERIEKAETLIKEIEGN